MSRNGSGTYSLPSGNPVVGGTTITSTWANTTLNDIKDALTDSLDRTGKGAMTAALKLVSSGTVGAPSLTISGDTDSGLFPAAAVVGPPAIAAGLGISKDATEIIRWTQTYTYFAVPLIKATMTNAAGVEGGLRVQNVSSADPTVFTLLPPGTGQDPATILRLHNVNTPDSSNGIRAELSLGSAGLSILADALTAGSSSPSMFAAVRDAGGTQRRGWTITSLGDLMIGTTGLTTASTQGHAFIQRVSGAPVGTPTTINGFAPIVYDDVNKKIWVYDNPTSTWLGIELAA